MNEKHQIRESQQTIRSKSGCCGVDWVPADKRAMMQASISELFEAQVARTPDRLAMKTATVQYSYAELNRAANGIARAILAEGGDKNLPVALCFSQRAHLLAAAVGIIKARRFLVILDQHSSPEQNRQIIADSQADLLCTDMNPVGFDQPAGLKLPRILRTDQLKPCECDDNPIVDSPPNPLVRIVYTSGSTGRPKGVIQTQQQILHGAINYHNLVRFTPDDRLLYVSTTAFIDPFVPWFCGGTILPIDLKMEGLPAIAERIREDGATVMQVVPTVLRHFVNILDSTEKFTRPRMISFVGEPVYRKHFEQFRTHFPETTFVHFLGSKECLDYRAFFVCPTTLVTDDHLPAGYAVEDTSVLLVDPTGKQVERGGIGEVAVKSPYLSSGYWNNPELTAQKFRDAHPGSAQRIYFTGDLGRFLPDGCLVTEGRNDFQVKIRGYQVRLDEVEMALSQVAGVAECAILLNSDRTALKSIAASRPPANAPFVAARTPIEMLVATIWADILVLDEIGINDHFLDLGGNSLQAMRIAARVQDEFDAGIPLAELFGAATVEEMALVVVSRLSIGISLIG